MINRRAGGYMSLKNADALMHHIMRQRSASEECPVTASGRLPDESVQQHDCSNMQMTETRIYVGLNDSQTRKQKFETEKYLGILKDICRNYHVAFSVDIEEGGYFHEDGEYTEETSLVLILIDADRDITQEIAKDLCTFFRQESVLITENKVTGYFLQNDVKNSKE